MLALIIPIARLPPFVIVLRPHQIHIVPIMPWHVIPALAFIVFSYVSSLYVLYVEDVAVHIHSLRFGTWLLHHGHGCS